MSDWENVGRKVVSTSKMTIGEAFQGTFLRLEENTTSQFEKKDKEGNVKKQFNLVFTDEEGAEVVVFPSGTINYKIDDGVFEEGFDYRITRQENKKGVKAGQFLVQRRKTTA